jgi:hypothetical protein
MRCLRLESLSALLLLPWIAAWSPVPRAVLVQVGQEEGAEAEEGGGGEGAFEEEAEEDSKEERWFAIA